MISIVLYGRNDNYGYNLHKRAALSLNCMAEVLTAENDEILFVDYNTPDDFPTFPEAISDTLTEHCRGKLRVLRIRPEIHERLFESRTHLKALESVSRNAAVRRSNRNNEWILSTNTDMIFVPLHGRSLTDAVGKLSGGFYCAPRLEIPETVWEDFDRKDATGVIEFVRLLGADIHLNEIVRGEDDILYDGPGDFQLIRRKDFIAIDGFHEDMLLGWHVDANISKRLRLLHGAISDAAPFVFGYHCDHTRQITPAHSHESPENDQNTFFQLVDTPAIPQQHETWGLAGLELEEINIRDSVGKGYLRAIRSAIGAPLSSPTRSDYKSDSYDQQPATAKHVLPFLIDLFASQPRSTKLAWLGARDQLFDLFARCWSDLSFAHSLGTPGQADDEDGAGASVTMADIIVVNFGVPDANSAARHGDPIRGYWRAVLSEAERSAAGAKPRQIITINTIHNRYESLVKTHLSCAKTPFSSRLRHGYFKKGSISFPLHWTGEMLVGAAGVRSERGIATNGSVGHILYGPYRALPPGLYDIKVTVTVQPSRKLGRRKMRRNAGHFHLETVFDEVERTSDSYRLKPGRHTLTAPIEVTTEDSFKSLQVRLHNANGCTALIEEVSVHHVSGAAQQLGRTEPA